MSARLATGLLVSALLRRVEAEGGSGMVLMKGDATAGAIMLVTTDRGTTTGVHERTLGARGYVWTRTGPADPDAPGALAEWITRRRRADPDLWVLELDHVEALALALALLRDD